ncbi:MAG: carbohydrate porin [Bacteroidetes bacterium]|nr:carbohydrate porin [Bacteroidota bacterium]
MKRILTPIILLVSSVLFGQSDSAKDERFSVHMQTTVITQHKPYFHAKYSGINSLISQEETQTSITSTLFLGARLWQGASAYLNPEIAGGSGLSGALGVGASTNGETYRVGDPKPAISLARIFFRQQFSFGSEKEYMDADQNQLGGMRSTHFLALTVGKVSLADYFDANSFSHDPRSQFLSWGLMSNGAWDYPANVKGYTPSAILEYVTPQYELRYHTSLLPKSANSSDMNWNIAQASGQSIEYSLKPHLEKGKVILRFLAFYNTANMGSYKQSIALAADTIAPGIIQTRQYGRSKYGFAFNMEAESPNKVIGGFIRAGWNDGNNETWVFTEIDQTFSAGCILKGAKWKRKNDAFGLAWVYSGLSRAHRDYLQAGGKGFILGDGNLNYGTEFLEEVYYSFRLLKNNVAFTVAYQFVNNPGYNKDRGPVNIFSVRVHAEI